MYSQTNELVNAKCAWNFASQIDLLNIFTPCHLLLDYRMCANNC